MVVPCFLEKIRDPIHYTDRVYYVSEKTTYQTSYSSPDTSIILKEMLYSLSNITTITKGENSNIYQAFDILIHIVLSGVSTVHTVFYNKTFTLMMLCQLIKGAIVLCESLLGMQIMFYMILSFSKFIEFYNQLDFHRFL